MKARKVSVVVSILGVLAGCAHDVADMPVEADAQDEAVLEQSIAPIIGLWAAATWLGAIASAANNPSGGAAPSSSATAALKSAGFSSIGGEADSSPAIASWGEGRLDVFVRAASGSLWQRAYTAGGSDWTELGGTLQGDPAAVSWGPGRIDVFARGSDNAMWHKAYDDGAWQAWRSLGGTFASAPAVASGAGRARRGRPQQLRPRPVSFVTASGSVAAIDGSANLDPAVAVENAVSPVVRSTNGSLYYRRFETGWSAWQQLPGTSTVQSAPAIAAGDGKVEVYVRGRDNQLYNSTYSGGRWANPKRIGGALTNAPDAVRSGPNRVDVVVTGPDKAVYHRFFSSEPSASRDSSSAGAPGI